MKKIILVCFFIAGAIITNAQGVEKKLGTSASASQLYFEAGGSGLIYSLNFDSRFSKTENGAGFRIGLGGAGGNDGGYFAVPAQINYLLGENGKYLELGAGATFFHLSDDSFFDDDSENPVYANLVIGFRSQPFGKKGLTWRVAFTPFIGSIGFVPFAGASIGYRF